MRPPALPFFMTFFLSPLSIYLLFSLNDASLLSAIFLLITNIFSTILFVGFIYLICAYLNDYAKAEEHHLRKIFVMIIYTLFNSLIVIGVWCIPAPLSTLIFMGAIPSLITALTSYFFLVEITSKPHQRFKFLKWLAISLSVGAMSSALLGAIAIFFLSEDLLALFIPTIFGFICALIACFILFSAIQTVKGLLPHSFKQSQKRLFTINPAECL